MWKKLRPSVNKQVECDVPKHSRRVQPMDVNDDGEWESLDLVSRSGRKPRSGRSRQLALSLKPPPWPSGILSSTVKEEFWIGIISDQNAGKYDILDKQVAYQVRWLHVDFSVADALQNDPRPVHLKGPGRAFKVRT